MANNDDNQSNYIPPNAQKVLFAEGLVNYILQTNSLPGILLSSDEQEESDVRICDRNMRMAVVLYNNTHRNYTERMFKFTMNYNFNNRRGFAMHVTMIKHKFFRKQLYHEAFLRYSVHLAQLAGKMCAQGFNEAPRIAANYIEEAMIFDVARFDHEITAMISRGCRGQSFNNIVLYRQQEELGFRQRTNPYNPRWSWGFGVPGSSRTESTNLNILPCYSSDSSEDENRKRKKRRLHDNN